MGIYHTTINLNFGERERERRRWKRERRWKVGGNIFERERRRWKVGGNILRERGGGEKVGGNILWERERERSRSEKAREEVKKWEYFWERVLDFKYWVYVER
jgi:hypothetical protein